MKGSDNPFPSVLVTEGTTPTAPAAGKQRLYIDSADHVLKSVNSASAVTSYSGGGLAKGTSFPGSPSDGDLYHRTDILGGTTFQYSSSLTKWLSAGVFALPMLQVVLPPATGTTILGYATPPNITGITDIYVVACVVRTQPTAAQSGTNYWLLDAIKDPASGAGTSLGTADTKADTYNQWNSHVISIGALMGTFASWSMLHLTATKNASAGNLYAPAEFIVKLVG